MRYIDLFAGIGGFALGLRQAGIEFEEHWFSEIDKNAISIYKKHFPVPGFVCCWQKERFGRR